MSSGGEPERGHDPSLDRVRAAAQSAFAMRLPGVPIADIAYDSLLDETSRYSGQGSRRLHFEVDGYWVEADVLQTRWDALLVQVSMRPPEALAVTARSRTTQETLAAPEGEPLRLALLPGIYSFVMTGQHGCHLVQTAWVRL